MLRLDAAHRIRTFCRIPGSGGWTGSNQRCDRWLMIASDKIAKTCAVR